jgi:Cu(I)/Ag(I) efflux system membrane fusion protein
MKRIASITAMLAAFLAGYGYGRWYAKGPAAVAAKTAPAVLFYRCPMHPSIHSDRPGASPCCHMAMVPVFASGIAADGGGAAVETAPPGSVRIGPGQEQLLGLDFATATSGVLTESLRLPARVGLDETRIAHVQTKLDGYVDQILVKTVGTEVRKGQLLLTVYHPKSLAAQEEYINAVKAVMGVNQESGGSTGGPRAANSEGLMAAARLRLELMGFTEMQIETMTKAMQPMWRLPVVAPIAGVVTEVNALPRQRLVPETLFTIADLSTVWATADLPVGETAEMAAGQTAKLRVRSLAGREFRAVVDSVLPQFDGATHTRKIRVRIDNPGRTLLPEMYGDLEIRRPGTRRAVLVPREAVLDRGLRQVVFVDAGQGVVKPRDVTVGASAGGRTEILRGLRPGERVVVSGGFLIDSESRLSSAAAASGRTESSGH